MPRGSGFWIRHMGGHFSLGLGGLMRCGFLCAKNKLGFQTLTNRIHTSTISQEPGKDGKQSLGTGPICGSLQSPRWLAKIFVLFWVVGNLWNKFPWPLTKYNLPELKTDAWVPLWSRRDIGWRNGTPGVPFICRQTHKMLETLWNCPCLSSAAPGNRTGFPGIFYTLGKGIPKYILLRPEILFLQLLPLSWFGWSR